MKGETLANLIQCGVTLLLGIIALAGALFCNAHSTSLPLWLVFGWHGFSIPTMSMG